MGKRSRTRISEPKKKTYPYKKLFYRDPDVAAHYDEERFIGPLKRRRNRLKWRTIVRALDTLDGPRRILDIPCGTGRFTGRLAHRGARVVGSDISHEMMRQAQRAVEGVAGVAGFVQADAERLPFADDAVDCVVCIRFMFHVDPPTRVSILRELGRVARWLVVDYRHRYSYRYAVWRLRRAFHLTRRPLERVSRASMEGEFHDAGLGVRRVLRVTRVFSDKWIVVAGRR